MRGSRACLLLVVLTSGCSFATMTPAHKLDKGQVVVQGALDEPGFLYIPRLSGQATFGTGGADLGVHVGTTLLTANAGVTARAYLGNTALTLQADGIITTFDESLFSSSGTRFGTVTLTPRVGRLLNEGESVYYGAQLHGILPFNTDDGDLPSGPGFAAGGYLGYAWDSPGNVDLQVELSAAPIGIFPEVFSDDRGYGIGVTPIVQLGFAVQYRREKHPPVRPTPAAPKDDRIL